MKCKLPKEKEDKRDGMVQEELIEENCTASKIPRHTIPLSSSAHHQHYIF